METREYESIGSQITEAEQALEAKRAGLQELFKDGRELERLYREIEEGQALVDKLYARWAELEAKQA